MLAVSLFFYFTFLRPEQSRLAALKERLEIQQKTLAEIERGDASQPTSQNSIKDALASLEAFKTEHLKPQGQGQRMLIDDINALVKKHNTRLTSGLEMRLETPADVAEAKKKNASSRDSVAGVFPMLAMNFTVAGQYGDLRAFISSLEKNRQFVVVRSVQLTAIDEGLVDQESGRRSSSNASAGLALTIGLSAYFQP
jgi:predicted transcriptional regulator